MRAVLLTWTMGLFALVAPIRAEEMRVPPASYNAQRASTLSGTIQASVLGDCEVLLIPVSSPKCVASSPWCMMVSLASNDPTREPSTKDRRRSAERSRNGLTLSLRNEAMADVKNGAEYWPFCCATRR